MFFVLSKIDYTWKSPQSRIPQVYLPEPSSANMKNSCSPIWVYLFHQSLLNEFRTRVEKAIGDAVGEQGPVGKLVSEGDMEMVRKGDMKMVSKDNIKMVATCHWQGSVGNQEVFEGLQSMVVGVDC